MSPTIQQVIEKIEKAPKYQPIPILSHDPPELRSYLRGRNATVKRSATDRLSVVRGLKGSVLDLGCNLGFFGFSASEKIERYYGVDNDSKCVTAAIALRDLRLLDHFHFETVDLVEALLRLRAVPLRYDFGIFLSTYHHLIGNLGYAKSRNVLALIGELCQSLFFDMGQKDEPNNPARAIWHNQLPDRDPAEFIIEEVTRFGGYENGEILGQTEVGGITGRLLFSFS